MGDFHEEGLDRVPEFDMLPFCQNRSLDAIQETNIETEGVLSYP
jgi:hypothetical protein